MITGNFIRFVLIISIFLLLHQAINLKSQAILKAKSHDDESFKKSNPKHQLDEDEYKSLESMEDLHHLTYLLLRNYNITDEGLLQASWLAGLSSALGSHKQHQYSSAPTSITNTKSRLALELESFISHLRNGHMRRMSQEDLETTVTAANLTDSLKALQILHFNKRQGQTDVVQTISISTQSKTTNFEEGLVMIPEEKRRCACLVTLYKYELAYRHAKQQEASISLNPEHLAGSIGKTNDAYSPANFQTVNSTIEPIPPNINVSSEFSHFGQNKTDEEHLHLSKNLDSQKQFIIDESRLLHLCNLAVTCQSTEDMVNLINRPWLNIDEPVRGKYESIKEIGDPHTSGANHPDQKYTITRIPRSSESVYDVKSQESDRLKKLLTSYHNDESLGSDLDSSGEFTSSKRNSIHIARKSLRDSLSLSLAKLCPLMLFQLHEDDEQCSVVRDDTPPMLAVWGFATLFVTIVSFCSLIGLSITPLIGQSPTTDDTSVGSSSSSSTTESSMARDSKTMHKATEENATMDNNHDHNHLNKQQKATLTIFEGLAVGSLVGSALFSLIPQAFELQERESNHSFLLKAFIIFSGIYLFFCSERIMRIILDSRQNSKRNKRLNNRSSTTAVVNEPISTAIVGQAVIGTQFTGSAEHRTGGTSAQIYATGASADAFPHDGMTQNQSALCQKQHQKDDFVSQHAINVTKTINLNAIARKSAVDSDAPGITSGVNGVPSAQALESRRKRRRQRRKVKICDRNGMSDSELKTRYDYKDFSLVKSEDSSESGESSDNRNWSSSTYSSTEEDDEDPRGKAQLEDVWSYLDEPSLRRENTISWDNSIEKHRQIEAKTWDIEQQDNIARPVFGIMSTETRPRRNRLNSSDYNDLKPQHQKREISTVAWMIILGDGLHNFIDGISIGAAFSESILSGVSISVAVICEEFPHELGDFAVLVSSGMTVRQALGYNFLSACTCYFGMAVGIILGDVTDGASYISALAAGVFLYIALVDMMGELSAALEASSRDSITRTLKLLFLQNVGIFIGISIIFVLSFIDF